MIPLPTDFFYKNDHMQQVKRVGRVALFPLLRKAHERIHLLERRIAAKQRQIYTLKKQ